MKCAYCPVETGSYEDNPPDLLEFMRRDSRWCQGNLQYFRLIGLPGLKPVSRVQLLWAILMFLGVPAGTMFAALLPMMTLHAQMSPTSRGMSSKCFTRRCS